MIKYNNQNINDWNFDTSNIIKVYRNNAVVYYKVDSGSGSTPTYKICYAVVDDISQYQDTEFVDVYDKTTNKWYKLNNLNQYEEYGVYGEGRSITYYDGKLTIDDGYEYQYGNNQWNNVGEVSKTSISDDFIIPFEDATTKTLCVNNWGGNVVAGEITYGEAKAVTSLGSVFTRNTAITSFNELSYFHGLTTLQNGEFAGCTNLTDVVIPSNIIAIGYNSASRAPFSGCTNLSGLTILSGEETLTMSLFSCNNSYYMYSNNSSTPFVFPNRPMTFESSTFGYCDYLMYAYFQGSTPPSNLANSDINMTNKIKNTFCPVDSLSAYQTALSGKGKTITEYDFETDSLGLLDKEKEWLEKTTTFTTYPVYYQEKSDPIDNLIFSSMTEADEYAYNNCVYDGEKSTINGDRYYFDSEDGWTVSPHTLPDVPFSVNYNAKNYNASTKTLLKTEGQLVDVDAVITAGTPTVGDGYLTIASGTRATISGYSQYFNRTSSSPAMTIVSKQRTDGTNCHMFANRDGNYNWMYRVYATHLTLHGTSETGGIEVTTQPVIESVRVSSTSPILKYNNYTDGTSSTQSAFSYGSTNSGNFALFQGYGTTTGENFVGDFYWVYMTQNTLTDEQVQQVIDYNENL